MFFSSAIGSLLDKLPGKYDELNVTDPEEFDYETAVARAYTPDGERPEDTIMRFVKMYKHLQTTDSLNEAIMEKTFPNKVSVNIILQFIGIAVFKGLQQNYKFIYMPIINILTHFTQEDLISKLLLKDKEDTYFVKKPSMEDDTFVLSTLFATLHLTTRGYVLPSIIVSSRSCRLMFESEATASIPLAAAMTNPKSEEARKQVVAACRDVMEQRGGLQILKPMQKDVLMAYFAQSLFLMSAVCADPNVDRNRPYLIVTNGYYETYMLTKQVSRRVDGMFTRQQSQPAFLFDTGMMEFGTSTRSVVISEPLTIASIERMLPPLDKKRRVYIASCQPGKDDLFLNMFEDFAIARIPYVGQMMNMSSHEAESHHDADHVTNYEITNNEIDIILAMFESREAIVYADKIQSLQFPRQSDNSVDQNLMYTKAKLAMKRILEKKTTQDSVVVASVYGLDTEQAYRAYNDALQDLNGTEKPQASFMTMKSAIEKHKSNSALHDLEIEVVILCSDLSFPLFLEDVDQVHILCESSKCIDVIESAIYSASVGKVSTLEMFVYNYVKRHDLQKTLPTTPTDAIKYLNEYKLSAPTKIERYRNLIVKGGKTEATGDFEKVCDKIFSGIFESSEYKEEDMINKYKKKYAVLMASVIGGDISTKHKFYSGCGKVVASIKDPVLKDIAMEFFHLVSRPTPDLVEYLKRTEETSSGLVLDQLLFSFYNDHSQHLMDLTENKNINFLSDNISTHDARAPVATLDIYLSHYYKDQPVDQYLIDSIKNMRPEKPRITHMLRPYITPEFDKLSDFFGKLNNNKRENDLGVVTSVKQSLVVSDDGVKNMSIGAMLTFDEMAGTIKNLKPAKLANATRKQIAQDMNNCAKSMPADKQARIVVSHITFVKSTTA